MSRTWVLAKKCANCMTWPFQELTRESNGEYGSFRRHSSESVSFRMQEFQPGASGRPLARPPFFLGFEVAALAPGHVVQAPSKIQSFNVQASSSPPNIISSRVHFANDLRDVPVCFCHLESDAHRRRIPLRISTPVRPSRPWHIRSSPPDEGSARLAVLRRDPKVLTFSWPAPGKAVLHFRKADRALHVPEVAQHRLQPSGPPTFLRAPRNRSG